jgi:RNA polymerase sigma-70 factor (ECF subfamily)
MLDKITITDWYDKYSGMIFQYIFGIVRDAHQAEDLTQDTFIKAYDY